MNHKNRQIIGGFFVSGIFTQTALPFLKSLYHIEGMEIPAMPSRS